MMEEGAIKESKSDWCSRPVIAKKANESFRFCGDYRDLNRHTQSNMYPMKHMKSVLDKLQKARYITKIDLKSAFVQVMVAEGSRQYTAFALSGSGLCQFRLGDNKILMRRILAQDYTRVRSIVSGYCKNLTFSRLGPCDLHDCRSTNCEKLYVTTRGEKRRLENYEDILFWRQKWRLQISQLIRPLGGWTDPS